jgi:hypothetical protein
MVLKGPSCSHTPWLLVFVLLGSLSSTCEQCGIGVCDGSHEVMISQDNQSPRDESLTMIIKTIWVPTPKLLTHTVERWKNKFWFKPIIWDGWFWRKSDTSDISDFQNIHSSILPWICPFCLPSFFFFWHFKTSIFCLELSKLLSAWHKRLILSVLDFFLLNSNHMVQKYK